MNRIAAFAVALGAALLVSCREKAPERIPERGVPPTNAAFALLVDSQENMGCLVDQKLVENAIPEMTRGVTLSGGFAGEDSATRRELYLGFDGSGQGKAGGYLVFRIWVEPAKLGDDPRAILSRPNMDWNPNGWNLTLRASGKGRLRMEPMGSRTADLERAWRSCPEADIHEPFSGSFLIAHRLASVLPRDEFVLAEDAQTLRVSMSKGAASLFALIRQEQTFLDELAKAFGTTESRWLWSERKLDLKSLKAIVNRQKPLLQVSIKPDSGPILATGQSEFEADLRLRIALLTADGERKGATISIGH